METLLHRGFTERVDLGPIDAGTPYPDPKEVSWSGEADSPEDALERANELWRELYGTDPPPRTWKPM